jgi:hypothetical protein
VVATQDRLGVPVFLVTNLVAGLPNAVPAQVRNVEQAGLV